MENTETEVKQNNLDIKQRSYATGKRKNSIARVWLKRGSGSISVNGKSLDKYFARLLSTMEYKIIELFFSASFNIFKIWFSVLVNEKVLIL